MTSDTKTAKPAQAGKHRSSSYRRKRRIYAGLAVTVMLIYSLLTLIPFYALAVRSTVPTKESTTLQFWIPEADEVNFDSQVGNLAVFYDLDLTDLKEALGIPPTEFLSARTSLRDISEEYDIPEEEIRGFFPRYPTKQAVVLPALHVVNETLRHVPREAIPEIAEMLELSPAEVQDTLSFYGF